MKCLIMGLLSLFSLSACAFGGKSEGRNLRSMPSAELVSVSLSEHGMMSEPNYSFAVQRDSDQSLVCIAYRDEYHSYMKHRVEPSLLDSVRQIIDQQRMYGYRQHYYNPDVLDGESWSFHASFADGQAVSSSGSNASPGGHGLGQLYKLLSAAVSRGEVLCRCDREGHDLPNGQPVLPGFHADPEVLYSHQTGRFYIYSTTDGTPGWGGYQFSVFSSQDLRDWTDEGVMLDVRSDQVPWATGNAWAPCIEEVRQADGSYRYYFYFSAHNPVSNRKEISVAVSESPVGPFVALDHPIVTDADRPSTQRGGQAIDVDVFRDPVSGKYYLYWGNGFMAGAELSDDMLSIKRETIVDLTPKGGTLQSWAYREGTYVIWRDGRYYFLWSVDDTGSPNYHVCYATASSPLGPLELDTEHYRVIEQRPEDRIYGTAHNSVLQIPGTDEWYIVYHRINADYVDGGDGVPGTHREVCIDRMTFDAEGRIVPVRPSVYSCFGR